MSHYAVAVFSDIDDIYEFDRLMEPYNECDKRYYTFESVPYQKIKDSYERFIINNPDSNKSFDAFIKDYGYQVVNDQFGYYCNPNGFYDYYTIDGKSYLFEPKKKEKMEGNFYRKNQIDFLKQNKSDMKHAAQFWEDYVVKGKRKVNAFYTREYYLERFKTKEQYVEEMTYTVPYAFVTPDGKWHAPGTMGWFACSDETAESYNEYFEKWKTFITDTSSNPYVSILDCHI